MSKFKNKLVAIMNKNIDPGIVMNALGHMCLGFGASVNREDLELIDFIDADESVHPNISKIPFIILRANSNKIHKLRKQAQSSGIEFADFTDTMRIGSWEEQIERTKQTSEQELEYLGIVMMGDWDKIEELTKKFSLWK